MPRFAANLSLMFTEWDFLDRFAVAADHGFRGVELQFPYDYEPEAIRQRLEAARLELVLINAPPGDFAAGDRGLAALPDRFDEFRASMARAMIYAEHLSPKGVHVMAGIAPARDPKARAAYLAALAYAADRLDGFDVLIEPINGRDMPGYFLNDFDAAAAIIAELGRPQVKLQFDIYHRQILHGDVLSGLQALMPIVGHIQIASVPTRAEPNSGELNDDRVLGRLDALGYSGYVGCEYRPAKSTVAGLEWLSQWRRRAEGEPMFRSTWREPDA